MRHNGGPSMELDLSAILVSLISSVSIGGVLNIIFQQIVRKKQSYEELNKNRFNLYKNLYFTISKNAIGISYPTETAKERISKFIDYVQDNKELSLLLSKEILILFKNFYTAKKDTSFIKKIQKRIEIDFKHLKKQFGYPCGNKLEKSIYFFFYFVQPFLYIISITFLLLFMLYIFGYGYDFNDVYIMLILFISFLALAILDTYYLNDYNYLRQ